jgi:hypothetical protein
VCVCVCERERERARERKRVSERESAVPLVGGRGAGFWCCVTMSNQCG